MTTLPPAGVNFFPEDSLEKQVYSLVENFKENIPISNDRNRLGFSLFKYMTGEGDPPLISVKAAKLKLEGMSEQELAKNLDEGLNKIKNPAEE